MHWNSLKLIIIPIGIILWFFIMAYKHRKQNENNIDDYYDDESPSL